MPKISVVMAVYNQQEYVGVAIESILNQTEKDFRFVIINDGSTDNSLNIIERFSDSRIVVLNNKKNEGLIYSLNRGLENSLDAEYVARMDSDDIALPSRFSKQVSFMAANPNTGLLGTNVRFFGDGVSLKKKYFVKHTTKKINSTLFCYNPIIHPTIMLRSSCFKKHDLKYDPEFLKYEDYALFIDTVGKFAMSNLDSVQLNYRRHSSNITNTYKENVFSDYDMFVKILHRLNTSIDIGLTAYEINTIAIFSHRRRAAVNPGIGKDELVNIIQSVTNKVSPDYFNKEYLKQLLVESAILYLVQCNRAYEVPKFLKMARSFGKVVNIGGDLVKKFL